MCGIAGYVQRGGHPPGLIDRMTARLAHRGPDGSGVWLDEKDGWHVALGHRRLSIIDLEGGRQPLGNEDGSVQVTYNGEIYNFQALRSDLERRGHRFATHCDTEAIVHHWEEHGAAGLRDFNGMFAFGLWDRGAGKLLLARDRAGIKPLYYAPLRDGGVAFASELSALLLHPGVERSLDPAGLASYFFADYVHPPHTMVKGARKLAPGQFLHWTCGAAAEPRPFWSAASASSSNGHATDAPDVAREVISRLDAAVASQMVADVPVGVFLSGGIDSSLVTALAARHSDHPLTTFSIGFADPQFDESRYARQVSAHVRTRHVEHTYTEAELLGSLDDALDCLDEPLADPSILPTYTLSKLAARHVKVVLGGDGGDELWGGYPTYKAHRLAAAYRHVPRLIRAALVAPVVARLPVGRGYQSFDWKVKRFALRWDDDPVLRHLRWMSNVDLPDLARALTASPGVPHSLRSASTAVGREARSVGQMLALDFKTYLPGSVLTKVDRAGMAHGLEVRPPMLDNTMIDLAFAVPASLKLQGGKAKALLKRAAAGLLPHEIIHRRKKGFAIPLSRWIAGPLMARVRAVVDSSPLWETGFLDRDVFAGWLEEHSVRSHDRSRPLWAAFVLDRWYRSTLAT